jgi:hypothetical protein
MSTPTVIAAVLNMITGIIPVAIYNHSIRMFWQRVGSQWKAHEQLLMHGPQGGEDV